MERVMETNKLALICDANYYRTKCYNEKMDLLSISEVKGFFSLLRSKEEKKGWSSYANPTVLIELMSHLASQDDPAFEVCLRSVIGNFEHCQRGGHLKLIADSESTLAHILYKIPSKSHLETTEVLSIICKDLHRSPTIATIKKHKKQFQKLQKQVSDSENYFISDFEGFVLQDIAPGPTTWKPFEGNKTARDNFLKAINSGKIELSMAKTLVLKTAIQTGTPIDFSDPQIVNRINFIKDYFKAPIELYQEILRRLAITGIDLTKKNRQNYIWDIQIVFSIPKDLLLDSKVPTLVTNDKDILLAAKNVGLSSRCISIQTYDKLIQ